MADTDDSDPSLAHRIQERVRWLARHDGRYAFEAFAMVSDAVQRTMEWLKSGEIARDDPGGDPRGELGGIPADEFHVSGRELLAGFERLARERWGLLADRVLAGWGVRHPEDVGEIVFLMVEDPELPWRKRPCDTRADFAADSDFAERLSWWPDDDPDPDGIDDIRENE